jgi:hypothetical protein
VQSEANVQGFYGSKDIFDKERFAGRTVDGDPNVRYMRTGDLGFLHTVSRPIGPGGSPVEMQVLFLLGNIGETFEVNGLLHFPPDIEESVERCHRNIVPSGCAVFQAGGLVVVLVEIFRKNFLASIVPVIVNSILNHHHLVVDIVAFVGKGDFPRSRLGEKQRGKILAGWVTRKVLTIAQFCIREEEEARIHGIAEEGGAIPKQSVGSRGSSVGLRPASTAMSMTSSMMGGTTRVPSQSQMSTMSFGGQGVNTYQPDRSSSNLLMPNPEYYQPSRPGEEPFDRPSSSNHVELPAPLDIPELPSGSFASNEAEVTPTNSGAGGLHLRNASVGTVDEIDEMLRHPQLALVTGQTMPAEDPMHYSPIDPRNNPFANSPTSQGRGSLERSPVDYEGLAYNEAQGSFDDMPPAPLSAAAVAATALVRDPHTGATTTQMDPANRARTPGYNGRQQPYAPAPTSYPQPDTNNDWYAPPPGIKDPIQRVESPSSGARNMLPSQMRRNSQALLGSRSQTDFSRPQEAPPPVPAKISPESEEADEEWRREALGYLGYAGVGGAGGHYGR